MVCSCPDVIEVDGGHWSPHMQWLYFNTAQQLNCEGTYYFERQVNSMNPLQ